MPVAWASGSLFTPPSQPPLGSQSPMTDHEIVAPGQWHLRAIFSGGCARALAGWRAGARPASLRSASLPRPSGAQVFRVVPSFRGKLTPSRPIRIAGFRITGTYPGTGWPRHPHLSRQWPQAFRGRVPQDANLLMRIARTNKILTSPGQRPQDLRRESDSVAFFSGPRCVAAPVVSHGRGAGRPISARGPHPPRTTRRLADTRCVAVLYVCACICFFRANASSASERRQEPGPECLGHWPSGQSATQAEAAMRLRQDVVRSAYDTYSRRSHLESTRTMYGVRCAPRITRRARGAPTRRCPAVARCRLPLRRRPRTPGTP